jgi:hypothetical protein
MRCKCGYLCINGVCPICGGKQIKGAEPKAHIPKHMRGFTVPGHFESLRYYYAWKAGIALETEKGRREIPQKTRDLIMRQYGRKCQWFQGCDTNEPPTVEHIRPVAFGGSNHPGNLTLLCPTHQRASWQRFEQLCLQLRGAA